MHDPSRTNKELIEENSFLKQRIQELEQSEVEHKRASDELRESEEKYRILLSESPDPTFSFTPEGQYRYVNRSFAEGIGKPIEDIIGKSIWDVFPKEEADERFASLSQVFHTGDEKVIEVRVPRVDGDRYYMTTITPVKDTKGEMLSAVCSSKDITERHSAEDALRESEERFRAFMDNMPSMVIIKDKELRPLFFNRKFSEMFPAKEWLGKVPEESFPPEIADSMRTSDLKALLEGFVTYEEEWNDKDYCLRILETRKFAIAQKDKAPLLGVIIADITDRRRAEEALRESENLYRTFINATSDMVFLKDQLLRNMVVNKSFTAFFGKLEGEIIGKNDFELMPQTIAEKCRQTDMEAMSNQTIITSEEIVGDQWFETVKFPVELGHHRIGVGGFIRDITDRKQAEEALQESETKLQAIFDTVGTGIIIIDKETQVIIEANQTAIEMTGLPKERIIGQICHSVVCPAQAGKCPVKDLGQRVDHSERKLLCADGNQRDILKTVYPITINARECYVESFIDISELKRAEMGLRQSKQQITDIIEFLPDATLAIDNDKRIIIWNQAIEEMTGIPAQEMIGKGDYAYTIPFYGEARPQLMDLVFKDREEIANKYPQITREGDNLMVEVFCNALYDNKGAWVYAKAAPLRDQDGNVKGVIEIIRDITEQKRYENALMDYQRNLADVINFLPDATFVIDKDGIVTAWNNAMASMTGIKAEEMIGKGNYEYAIPFYGERRPIIIDLILSVDDEFLSKSYDEVQRKESFLSGEVYVPKILGGKGAYLWGNASRLYNSRGEVIGAIQSIRDITDRRQAEAERLELEARLQRAEKMESLGLLAGGVAHDLNNVLGIVVGYAEMLIDEMDKSNPMRDDLKKILEGGNRSAAIVQDLLTLARRGVQTKKTLNLNSIFADCQKTPEFEKVFSYNPQVKIKTDLESDLLNITGSPVHLGKTIINLASNAVEAMPSGGVFKITTTNQYLDMPIHGYDNIREGDYVVLTVSDTGEGILERDIKRIFEPFYTKKIMGRSGTGLGLAVVWGTIKDHNGYINVESEEGKGTTFTLYFPVTREEMESEQISISMSEYMGRGETILVVDDINRQRELASRMLTKLNYIVITVASGEEAIEYLKTNKADLIVLDMIMDPGIDGLETYEKILKLNPIQKAVIVSGFSESDRVKEAQRIGAGAYVPKPYVLERLGMAVRKELGRK